jgi:hypothetical protein
LIKYGFHGVHGIIEFNRHAYTKSGGKGKGNFKEISAQITPGTSLDLPSS